MPYKVIEQRTENAPTVLEPHSGDIGVRWVLEFFAWLFIIVMLVWVFALAVLSPAFAGVSAGVKASNEQGFARIIISFSDLPNYKNDIDAGIFVLSFDKPVDVDVSHVPGAIPDYVGQVRRDPDGRAIRIALIQPYQINIMEAGLELFIDFLPPDWKGNPPPLPAATIKALTEMAIAAERRLANEIGQRKLATTPYKLNVRLGRHPTFSRLVFQWNKFVKFKLTRKGRMVELSFNQSSAVDLSQARADPPKFLQGIDAVKTSAGMAMRLTVDEDVDVRGFREGLSYVLDLTGPDALAEASATAKAAKLKAMISTPSSGENAGAARGASAGIVTRDIDPAALSGTSFAQEQPREPDVTGAAKHPRANPGQAGIPKARAAGAVMENAGASLSFTFQFKEPIAAAIFRRGRSIWSVFDSDARLDLKALRHAGKGMIESVEHLRFDDAQYIRITLKEPQLMHVTYSNNGWHMTIGDMAGGGTNPLTLMRALRGDKQSLIRIKMKNYGQVHWLTDPEIGDRFAVVTAFPPQRNIAKQQELVDFTAFATAQGIVIRPRTDDVAVRLHRDEVLVTSRNGLTLSAGNASQYRAGKKALRETARTGFIDFKPSTVESPGVLSDNIHDMLRQISVAPEKKVNYLRFDLAMLYLANSLYVEALGLLHRMANLDEYVESDPAYNAMRGATLVLMGRQKDARKDFEVHALANATDASLWRGLIATSEQKWAEALRQFKDGADAIGSYRADIQARFRMGAVRAALETGKLTRAAAELNAIPRENLPTSLRARLQLLTARYLDRVGRIEEARESYKVALDSTVQQVVAEARLHSTLLDLRTGKIDREQALKELERLQLFWRGDDIELRTLRALANLYVKEKRYAAGFTVMRNSINAFPKQEIALKIQDDMKQVFKNLFLHGDSDELDPVRALGLFYGYRELTPVGRLGDDMIRNLANRLIKIDLLDQASELLDHQVNKRLKGAARAQVATRLAMVHLMNHKANLALRAIRRTRQAGLPEDLHTRRNLLEARALGELGRSASAIEILNEIEGPDVDRLKADAYWNAKDWKGASSQLEKMLGGRWRKAKALNEQERLDVLRAAIGYSLADDQFALDRISKKYYSKMVKTADAASFILVTKPIMAKGVAFRNLAKEIAAIGTLDAFMKQFRARYDRTSSKSRSSAKKTAG